MLCWRKIYKSHFWSLLSVIWLTIFSNECSYSWCILFLHALWVFFNCSLLLSTFQTKLRLQKKFYFQPEIYLKVWTHKIIFLFKNVIIISKWILLGNILNFISNVIQKWRMSRHSLKFGFQDTSATMFKLLTGRIFMVTYPSYVWYHLIMCTFQFSYNLTRVFLF